MRARQLARLPGLHACWAGQAASTDTSAAVASCQHETGCTLQCHRRGGYLCDSILS